MKTPLAVTAASFLLALAIPAPAQEGAPPDPQMKAVLDELGALGGKPIATLSPEEARKQIMIGDKAECLETIARYRKAGVTHFIFMTFAPYNVDEMQAFAEEVIPSAR